MWVTYLLSLPSRAAMRTATKQEPQHGHFNRNLRITRRLPSRD